MTAISQSYIQNILRAHFSAEDFTAVTQNPNGKNLILPYQIVLGKSNEEILTWLKECNEKYRDYINASDHATQYFCLGQKKMAILESTGLPPLSIAVLMEREEIVDALCASPHINFEKQDRRGWTALQHALALGNRNILERIERAIGPKAKERFPFLRKVANPSIVKEGHIVVGYRTVQGAYCPLTQEEFQKLSGGFLFYDGVVGSQDALSRNWYHKWFSREELFPWMAERYAAYCKNPPKLILIEEAEIEQPGVRTERLIEQGEFVTFYDPELVFKNEQGIINPDEHHVLVVRTLHNFGSHINDGFPNVYDFPLMVDGLQLSGYLALRDIQPEEQLFCDYGFIESLKLEERIELAFDRIQKAFPRIGSLKEALREIAKTNKKDNSPEAQFRYHKSRAGLAYLIHTPSALLNLVLRGHFSASQIESFMKEPALQVHIPCEKKLADFYSKALPAIRAFEEQKPSMPNRVFVAKAFERNPRAALFALKLAQKAGPDVWRKEFTALYQRAKEFSRAKSEPDLAVDVDRVLVQEAPLESKSGLGVVDQA